MITRTLAAEFIGTAFHLVIFGTVRGGKASLVAVVFILLIYPRDSVT